MDLSYLTAGSTATAGRMNTLFAAFDSKLTHALGGKTFLVFPSWGGAASLANTGTPFATGTWSDPLFFGKPFYFLSSPTSPYLTSLPEYTGDSYDHSVYTALASGATATAWDDTNHIVSVDLDHGDLNGSLEAHWRVKPAGVGGDETTHYYLMPVTGTVEPPAVGDYPLPEKRYRFTVAELICDGITTLTIPTNYDKHNCFRVHNLHTLSLTVTVTDGAGPGIDAEFVVPPLGIKAIRRVPGGRVYDAGWKYFWLWLPSSMAPQGGDPRFYNLHPSAGLYDSMAANNLANPALLIHWLQVLRDRCEFDWSKPEPPVPEAAKFGNASNTGTVLGDLIHHKGDLVVASKVSSDPWTFTTVSFASHAQLETDLTALGLTVTEVLGQTFVQEERADTTTDLICLSTNLLRYQGAHRDAVNVNSAVGLEGSVWSANVVIPFSGLMLGDIGYPKTFSAGGSISFPCQTWNGSSYDDLGFYYDSPATMGKDTDPFPNPWPMATDTVATMNLTEGGLSPNTEYGQFTNVSLAPSVFGFGMHFTEELTPVGDVSAALNEGMIFDVSAGKCRASRFVVSDFNGWSYDGNQWLSCLHQRAYPTNPGDAPVGIENARINADGKDFNSVFPEVTGHPTLKIQQELTGPSLAGCDTGASGSGLTWRYGAPDYLHAFEATDAWYSVNRSAFLANSGPGDRPQICPLLCATQYNTLAYIVNCWTAFKPLQITEVFFPYTYDGTDYLGRLAEYGPFGTDTPTVLPRGTMTAWLDGSAPEDEARWAAGCAYFGIPVLDDSDLPSSYQDRITDGNTTWDYTVTVHGHVELQTLADPPRSEVRAVYDSNELTVTGTGNNTLLTPYADLKWVKHHDVAVRAGDLGFAFLFSSLARPMDLVRTVDGATDIFGGTTDGRVYDGSSHVVPADGMLMPSWSPTVGGWITNGIPGGGWWVGDETFETDTAFQVQSAFANSRDSVSWQWMEFVADGSVMQQLVNGDLCARVWLAKATFQNNSGQNSTINGVFYDQNASTGYLAMLAVESSSNTPTGTLIENRVMISPKEYLSATVDYVLNHDLGPDLSSGYAAGYFAALSLYRPWEAHTWDSQPGATFYDLVESGAETYGTHTQTIPFPLGAGSVWGRCYHAYLQSRVSLAL